jgi:predicted MFS family arabinose efflux permease
LARVRIALASPRLRRIIAAYGVNRLGTWFAIVALSVAVFDHTHSALAVSALLFAAQALPALVIPAIVARAEASSASGQLSRLYVFEALITTALAVLMWHFVLSVVLVLVALDGAAAMAASALVRSEVARAAREDTGAPRALANANGEEPDVERAANAALNAVFSTTFVIGPALGGVVVAAAGAATALFVDVASFALGALLLAHVRSHVEDARGDSVRERLAAAWQHVRESPMLRRALVAELVALVFIESGGPIEVTLVKATLHAGDRGLGLLLTAWGAGAVLGSMLFARLLRVRLAIVLSAGTLAIAIAFLGLAAAPSLFVACLAGVLGGIGNGLQWPSLVSIVQRLTPEALQGRLMGGIESLGAVCVAVALPLGGALTALTSARTAFWIVGSGAALATLGFVRLRVESQPHVDRAATADAEAQPATLDAPPYPLAAPAGGRPGEPSPR